MQINDMYKYKLLLQNLKMGWTILLQKKVSEMMSMNNNLSSKTVLKITRQLPTRKTTMIKT